MKATEWANFILRVADEAKAGDPENLERLAMQLEMDDKAKQELRDNEYGWTGLNLLETVRLVRL